MAGRTLVGELVMEVEGEWALEGGTDLRERWDLMAIEA